MRLNAWLSPESTFLMLSEADLGSFEKKIPEIWQFEDVSNVCKCEYDLQIVCDN